MASKPSSLEDLFSIVSTVAVAVTDAILEMMTQKFYSFEGKSIGVLMAFTSEDAEPEMFKQRVMQQYINIYEYLMTSLGIAYFPRDLSDENTILALDRVSYIINSLLVDYVHLKYSDKTSEEQGFECHADEDSMPNATPGIFLVTLERLSQELPTIRSDLLTYKMLAAGVAERIIKDQPVETVDDLVCVSDRITAYFDPKIARKMYLNERFPSKGYN